MVEAVKPLVGLHGVSEEASTLAPKRGGVSTPVVLYVVYAPTMCVS